MFQTQLLMSHLKMSYSMWDITEIIFLKPMSLLPPCLFVAVVLFYFCYFLYVFLSLFCFLHAHVISFTIVSIQPKFIRSGYRLF